VFGNFEVGRGGGVLSRPASYFSHSGFQSKTVCSISQKLLFPLQ